MQTQVLRKNQLATRSIFRAFTTLTLQILALFMSNLIGSTTLFAYQARTTYVFRNFQEVIPEKMRLVGRIQSKGRHSIAQKDGELGEYDMRTNRVIVKLFDRKQIKVGQTLYVIDKHAQHESFPGGMVIGEVKAGSIFYSPMYGWVLSATGNLIRIREGHFVARESLAERLQEAFVIKRKGDHSAAQANFSQAIAHYQTALSIEPALPEAHVALANIYLQKHKVLALEDLPWSTLNHYEQAWKYRENFHYPQEKLAYYLDFIEGLNFSYEISKVQANQRQNLVTKYLDRILAIGGEARQAQEKLGLPPPLTLITALARAHYYRMLAYAKQENPEQRSHYDHSMRKADFWLKQALSGEHKSGELIRVSILFYGYRYKRLQANKATDPKLLGQMRLMLLQQLKPYYSLYLDSRREKRDPKVDQLLESL